MSEYIFERVTPGHYHLLKELYLNAFNSKIDIQGIQKRFDTTALGCEHIGFIAIHRVSMKPAAYYGVFPHQLKIHDTIITVCQSGDVMTHTEHRNKGLFVVLGNLTFDLCKKMRLQMVYCLPIESTYSYRGHIQKLNLTHKDNVNRWDLKLSFKTFPLAKVFSKTGMLRKLYLIYAKMIMSSKIIHSIESFANSYNTDYAKVYRDKNYLNYKQSIDKLFIKVDNQVIWIKLSDVFWIGDFSDYASVKPSTIKKLKRLSFLLGYNTISFNINESLILPSFLSAFKKYSTEAFCLLPFNPSLENTNILFTGADFDTW